MDKQYKILVVPSDRFGCGLYRSVNPHSYIQDHYGDLFHIDIVYDLPTDNFEDFVKDYDMVHFHKQLDKDCKMIKMLKFLGKTVVCDVDDYWNLGDYHPMSLSAKKENWAGPIIEHLKLADAVTTTTPIFANKIKKYNKNVFVLPNAIDPTDKQFCIPKTKSDRLRVGLICGSSHLHDIELLRNLYNQVPLDKVQLVLCGFDTRGTRTIYYQDTGKVEQRPIKPEESVWYEYEKIITNDYKIVNPIHKQFLLQFIQGLNYNDTSDCYMRYWTKDIHEYAAHYSNIDVLLAPLMENDFNKCKSELKVAEAGFTHTAIIAQNFGAYTIGTVPMVEYGGKINPNGNCLLVDTKKNHKQWGKYVTMLANNPDMVKALQENLYNHVKDRYSLEAVSKDRVKIYLDLINKKNINNGK